MSGPGGNAWAAEPAELRDTAAMARDTERVYQAARAQPG